MISLYTSTTEIQQIRNLLEDKIHNEYLKRHIQKPIIHEGKLQILAELVFNCDSLTDIQTERYIITTMMVQIALDTHDLVPVGNKENESKEEKLSKQLNVLAGDYYSGLYYYLLSEIEDVELIHTLAIAIKNINECKMKLYYKEIESFEVFMDVIKQIDSILLVRVAQYLYGNELNQVITEWLLTERLLFEKIGAANDRISTLVQWKEMNIEKTYTARLVSIDSLIEQQIDKVGKALTQLPDKFAAFQKLFRKKLENMSLYQSSIVEEG
ncbi:heptaprenyl diphosphate synthase component 1 [Oceanobacillus sp. FSL K6-2867]|uniref:heptaprenyl diphosphate synthase component 1 n=1 Tax=Oceanobacillus sp. FSL K6-2867 TaxID=2954748 RepID=UPI0030DB7443